MVIGQGPDTTMNITLTHVTLKEYKLDDPGIARQIKKAYIGVGGIPIVAENLTSYFSIEGEATYLSKEQGFQGTGEIILTSINPKPFYLLGFDIKIKDTEDYCTFAVNNETIWIGKHQVLDSFEGKILIEEGAKISWQINNDIDDFILKNFRIEESKIIKTEQVITTTSLDSWALFDTFGGFEGEAFYALGVQCLTIPTEDNYLWSESNEGEVFWVYGYLVGSSDTDNFISTNVAVENYNIISSLVNWPNTTENLWEELLLNDDWPEIFYSDDWLNNFFNNDGESYIILARESPYNVEGHIKIREFGIYGLATDVMQHSITNDATPIIKRAAVPIKDNGVIFYSDQDANMLQFNVDYTKFINFTTNCLYAQNIKVGYADEDPWRTEEENITLEDNLYYSTINEGADTPALIYMYDFQVTEKNTKTIYDIDLKTQLAHQIKKAYIGIGGLARPIYSAYSGPTYYGEISGCSNSTKCWIQSGGGASEEYAVLGGGIQASYSTSGTTEYSIKTFISVDKDLVVGAVSDQQYNRERPASAYFDGKIVIALGDKDVTSNSRKNIEYYDGTTLTLDFFYYSYGSRYYSYHPVMAATSDILYLLGIMHYSSESFSYVNKNGTFSFISGSKYISTYVGLDETNAIELNDKVYWLNTYDKRLIALDNDANGTIVGNLSLKTLTNGLVATTVSNYIIFNGGTDNSTGRAGATTYAFSTDLTQVASVQDLSEVRQYTRGVSLDGYALYYGGGPQGLEYYDEDLTLSACPDLESYVHGGTHYGAAALGNYALYLGGQYFDAGDNRNTYNLRAFTIT